MSKTKSYEWNFRSGGEKERREIKLSHPTCGGEFFVQRICGAEYLRKVKDLVRRIQIRKHKKDKPLDFKDLSFFYNEGQFSYLD